MIFFSSAKLRTKNLFRPNKKFAFLLILRKICWKNSWNKLVKNLMNSLCITDNKKWEVRTDCNFKKYALNSIIINKILVTGKITYKNQQQTQRKTQVPNNKVKYLWNKLLLLLNLSGQKRPKPFWKFVYTNSIPLNFHKFFTIKKWFLKY